MNAFRCFLGSRLGVAATIAIAALGVYLFWIHADHVLAAAPFLLLLACPLMHLFGHKHGHGHASHGNGHTEEPPESRPALPR
jgi:hypothetical protein